MKNLQRKRILALSNEIKLIQNSHIRNMIKKILLKAPKYFWEIPSSLKGLHHPIDEFQRGGLILHTKRAVYLSLKLCELENVLKIDQDKLIGAMIIHDICQRGVRNKALDHLVIDHPFYVKRLTRSLKSQRYYEEIMSIVEAHLGRWTPKKYKIKKNKLAKMGHIADYIVSRREISIKI